MNNQKGEIGVGGVIGIAVLVLIVITLVGAGLGWFSRANALQQEKVFAPQEEAVRRNTFEKSRAYNAGTIQNMRSAQMDYISAPSDRKAGLGSVIIQQYADYPDDAMPSDLRAFVICLRNHQGQKYDCS